MQMEFLAQCPSAVLLDWLSSQPASLLYPPVLGFLGAVTGALVSATFQSRNTRQLIASEYRKIGLQSDRQSLARLVSRKEDVVAEKVVKLLNCSDPEIQAKLDYSEIVSAVHSIQLFLDCSIEGDRRLSQAIRDLALVARELISPAAEEEFALKATSLNSQLEEVEAMENEIERVESLEKGMSKAQSLVMAAAQSLLQSSMDQYQSLSSSLISKPSK